MSSKDNASGSLEGLISIGIVWGVASAVGFAAMAVLMLAADWSVLQGLFAAAIIFFALGTALSLTMLQPLSGPVEPGTAGVAPRTAAPAPDPGPAPTPATNPAPEPAATPAAEVATVVTDNTGFTGPKRLDGPRTDGADNLRKIKGVGPKLEKLLHSMGFYHFDQIAEWTTEEVEWVDENLEGFKGRVTRDDWVPQAKILAAGGETEFSRKQGGGS